MAARKKSAKKKSYPKIQDPRAAGSKKERERLLKAAAVREQAMDMQRRRRNPKSSSGVTQGRPHAKRVR